jgi:hypothetical protein
VPPPHPRQPPTQPRCDPLTRVRAHAPLGRRPRDGRLGGSLAKGETLRERSGARGCPKRWLGAWGWVGRERERERKEQEDREGAVNRGHVPCTRFQLFSYARMPLPRPTIRAPSAASSGTWRRQDAPTPRQRTLIDRGSVVTGTESWPLKGAQSQRGSRLLPGSREPGIGSGSVGRPNPSPSSAARGIGPSAILQSAKASRPGRESRAEPLALERLASSLSRTQLPPFRRPSVSLLPPLRHSSSGLLLPFFPSSHCFN